MAITNPSFEAGDGTYSLTVNADEYIVIASKSLYDNNVASVDAKTVDQTQNFTLTSSGATITGRQNSLGTSIPGGISSGKQTIPGISIQGGISLGA